MAGLRPKQERFVAEYLVDLNATQAAIRAGYSEKTAGATGHENLKKPEIAKAIEEAQKKAQERIDYTADDWRRDVMRLAEKSEQASDASNALKARDMLGKSLGIYSEKRDLTSSDGSMSQKPTTIIFNGVGVDDAED
jgi:phage terminase small subunit